MRIGIVGSGKIVLSALDAMRQIPDISCEAICVREKSLEKGMMLQQEYGIGKVYTDYAEFLQDEDIDIVYVAVINSLHFAFAITALEAGKHVICEKPFTSTIEELKKLAEVAKDKALFLFEAITMLYSPNFHFLRDELHKVGKVKLVQANYSQHSSRYADYKDQVVLPAFDPHLSGGALYDINIYNVHFVAGLFGMPEHVQYIANKGFNGIDTSGVLVMQYPEFVAVCTGAKDSQSPCHATVQGDAGYIRITSAVNVSSGVELYHNEKSEIFNLNQHENHMVNEFQAFADMLKQHDLKTCYKHLDHSLIVMEILSLARKNAGIKFPADDEWV